MATICCPTCQTPQDTDLVVTKRNRELTCARCGNMFLHPLAQTGKRVLPPAPPEEEPLAPATIWPTPLERRNNRARAWHDLHG
jgi:hypothetical protein